MVGRRTAGQRHQRPNELKLLELARLGLWKPSKAIRTSRSKSRHPFLAFLVFTSASLRTQNCQEPTSKGKTRIVTFENFSSFHIRN
jgi:hypothetical protein